MYLDPSFGGAVMQILVAIAAAGGIFVFALRRKLRALFSGRKKQVNEGDTADKATDDTGDEAGDDMIDMLSDDD